MTTFQTPCRMYEPEADAWLDLPVPLWKPDVRVEFARIVTSIVPAFEEAAAAYRCQNRDTVSYVIAPPCYRAFGKQVKHGDVHVADAVDNETADRIAAALNGEMV